MFSVVVLSRIGGALEQLGECIKTFICSPIQNVDTITKGNLFLKQLHVVIEIQTVVDNFVIGDRPSIHLNRPTCLLCEIIKAVPLFHLYLSLVLSMLEPTTSSRGRRSYRDGVP